MVVQLAFFVSTGLGDMLDHEEGSEDKDDVDNGEHDNGEEGDDDDNGEIGVEDGVVVVVEVYFKIRSVHRWKTDSDTCKRQLMASRNVISFMLISCALRPEILLHARAE